MRCLCGHHWDDHDEVLDWPENFQPPQRPCCDCGCDNYTPRVEAKSNG